MFVLFRVDKGPNVDDACVSLRPLRTARVHESGYCDPRNRKCHRCAVARLT